MSDTYDWKQDAADYSIAKSKQEDLATGEEVFDEADTWKAREWIGRVPIAALPAEQRALWTEWKVRLYRLVHEEAPYLSTQEADRLTVKLTDHILDHLAGRI